MRDLFGQQLKRKVGRFLLDLDARIDFAVFQGGRRLRESYESFSAFMDRFHVAGARRGLVEAMPKTATLGEGGRCAGRAGARGAGLPRRPPRTIG